MTSKMLHVSLFSSQLFVKCTNLYLLCFQVYKFVTPVFISKRIVTFICRLTNLDSFIYKVDKQHPRNLDF